MAFNFADLFELVADHIPDREAVVTRSRRLTYADLDERATRLANHLASKGIGRGDNVGLYLYNGTEYLEGMLGCAKIGAAGVNVNYRYVEDELRYLFDDADLKGLVFHREFAPHVAAVRDDVPTLSVFLSVDDGSDADTTVLGADDYEEALDAASAQRDFEERSPDDLYILYTGGTTGMPKGVMWRQEDAFFACFRGGDPLGIAPVTAPEELRDKIDAMGGAQTNMQIVPPLMHGAAQWASFIGLYGGNRIILDESRHFDAGQILDLARDENSTALTIVGDAIARPIVDELERNPREVPGLFIIGSGGAILSDVVKRRLKELLPQVTILDSYGVSETGYQGSRAGEEGGPRFQVDESTAVLDESLRIVPAGSDTIGMLARTGHIPLGYYGDEEKTKRTFVLDPDGRRWSLPGDMAQVEEDGTIKLLGRGSVSINTGGEKVYPEEVESVLKAHPEIFDAVVVGVPDERWGEHVAAVVQVREGADVDLDDVKAHAGEHLARYKVPKDIHVVAQVVRSPSGKPDYRWAKRAATEDA